MCYLGQPLFFIAILPIASIYFTVDRIVLFLPGVVDVGHTANATIWTSVILCLGVAVWFASSKSREVLEHFTVTFPIAPERLQWRNAPVKSNHKCLGRLWS